MLSNTSGLTRHSRVLKARTDVTSKLTKMCPHMKRKNRCKAHEMENRLRISLTRGKEEEIRRKAMKLYKLQQEVMELEHEESESKEHIDVNSNNKSTNTSDYENSIESIILELKQEPEYARWNLESAIEEEMIRLHMKRCPFSHQRETLQALKQARKEHRIHEQKEISNNNKASTSKHKQSNRVNEWHENKVNVFRNLSVIQRIIACIMWQRSTALPRKVMVNVRKEMEERIRSTWESLHNKLELDTINSLNDKEQENVEEIENDSVQEYLMSDEFKERVAIKENESVSFITWQPEFGIVNLSFSPAIISYISNYMSSTTIIKPETASFFFTNRSTNYDNNTEQTIEYEPVNSLNSSNYTDLVKLLQIKPITEKQVDLSSPRVVEELVTVVEWIMYLYNSYTNEIQPLESIEENNCSTNTNKKRKRIDSKRSKEERNMENMNATPCMSNECTDNSNSNTSLTATQIVLRSLTLQSCAITSAEVLVDSLRKHNLHHHLLALDLSHNKLYSLRFLFALRAYYGRRLLRLSLMGNAITAKPEYVEQVRRSLPQLTVLDGKPIRHALLKWWHPTAMSSSLLEHEEILEKSNNTECKDGNKATKQKKCNKDCKKMENEKANYIQITTNTLTSDEVAMVMDSVYRLTYIWEERRIPHTLREVESFLENNVHNNVKKRIKRGKRSRSPNFHSESEFDMEYENDKEEKIIERTSCDNEEDLLLSLPEEEIWSEDNFPHRYLDEFVTFSFTIDPALHFFDPNTMLLDKIAEMNNSSSFIEGKTHKRNVQSRNTKAKRRMILSAEDYTQLKTLDVSLRNASRELMHGGKTAIFRAIRGAREVFTAYQLTLYGARMQIRHYLSSAVIAIHKLHESTNTTKLCSHSDDDKKEQSPLYMVTLHGVMSIQLPSMIRDLFTKNDEELLENNLHYGNLTSMSVSCYYDRVLTFTHRTLPSVNRAWERHRSPAMVLCNDQLHLRPIPQSINYNNINDDKKLDEDTESEDAETSCLYTHFNKTRITRLLIKFGLECCGEDGMALVQCVMERANSDASEHAALDVLVFGLKHIHESNYCRNKYFNEKSNIVNKTVKNMSDNEQPNNFDERDESTTKCHQALCKLLRHYILHYSDKMHLLEKKRTKHTSCSNREEEEMDDKVKEEIHKTDTFRHAFRIFSIINDDANKMNGVNEWNNSGDDDEMCNLKKWIQGKSMTSKTQTNVTTSQTTKDVTTQSFTEGISDIDNKIDLTLLQWSSTSHIITLTLLNAVVKLTNKYITHNFFKENKLKF